MSRLVDCVLSVMLIVGVVALCGCSNTKEGPLPAKPAASNESAKAPSIRKGSITATPNPIRVCGNAKSGKTTITWEASGVKDVEIRIGAPDGALFGRGPLSGAWPTGDWVANGQVFYLQDVSDGLPLAKSNTLASVTVMHTAAGCK